MKKLIGNKKGIQTILAALLMVVIVVVASVMVYAWSTGLLSSLLVQNPVPRESINMENYTVNGTAATLSLRNAGTASVGLATYYAKDSTGNTYTLTWPTASQPSIAAGAVLNVGICVGSTTPQSTNCGTLTYTGSSSAVFKTGSGTSCPGTNTSCSYFISGNSYTITVVTAHSNQFSFTVIR